MTDPPRTPMPGPRCSSVAALFAVAALIAGCGGSSSSNQTATFNTSYQSSRDQLKETSQAIGTAIQHASSQTDAQIRSTFRTLAKRWQTQLSQLQALKPAPLLSADFNTLTGAGARVESDLNGIVSAAATHSRSAAEQAAANLVSDITTLRQADAKINRKLRGA